MFDIIFIIHFVCVCLYNLNVDFVFLKRNGLDCLKARSSSNMGVYYFICIEGDLAPLFFALENSLNTLQFAST